MRAAFSVYRAAASASPLLHSGRTCRCLGRWEREEENRRELRVTHLASRGLLMRNDALLGGAKLVEGVGDRSPDERRRSPIAPRTLVRAW